MDQQEFDDLLMFAWTVICNTSEGDWKKQTPEWQKAASLFREKYHKHLGIKV